MTRNPLVALLVEDDPSWREILIEILNDYGLRVHCTDNLQDAIEMLRGTNYKLAIVDLSLAGQDHHNQDGLQVLNAIQRFAPGCKGILLTGHASVELAIVAIQEFGALTCLQKENFRRSELREIISKVLVTPDSIIAEISEADTKNKLSVMDKKPTTENELTPLALVVEDDAGWRSLLTELLLDSGFEVHLCSSYGEASGLLQRDFYQLAIADISLASSLEPENNQDGFRLLKKTQKAGIPTVIVSGFADPDLIDQAYSDHQIFACFEKQSFNRKGFVQTVAKIGDKNLLPNNLTKREVEVLSLVAQGLGNKEIASNLHISTNTVKRHLKSIYAKLEVNTRAAASAYAVQRHIGTGI
jgi:DNA-binding NarL/FixJ family response regulator